MKILSIIVFVIVFQYCDSDSTSLFYSMSAKVNELSKKMLIAFKSLKNKIKSLMPSEEKSITLPVNPNLYVGDFMKKQKKSVKNKFNNLDNLRSDPTVFMSTPEIATSHGQKVESHVVLTKDGYLITLHRLKSTTNRNGTYYGLLSNCTVLLHHGLLGSSADWILLGERSLPYLLTSQNCDVWLTNARGNYYSRGHIWNKIVSKEFWNFSWTEMGQYDLPAVVNFIRKIKNTTEPINFIGYSMGATVFLAMLSILPKYNEYFRMAILLAPLVLMASANSPLRLLSSVANNPPEYILNLLGNGEFMPNKKIILWIAGKYCNGSEIFCTNSLLFITGSIHAESFFDKDLVTRVFHHLPAGGSTKTILHYTQMIKSGKFQIFQNDSQEISLKGVTVPIVLFSSNTDSFAPSSDVLRLFNNISCPVDHYIISDLDFKHTDFVLDPAADILVFERVIDFLRKTPSCK